MSLDRELLQSISKLYRFNNLEFVNKDFYVSEVLKIISSIKPDFCDVYDIYSIHPVVDTVLLKTLVREIAKQDAAAFETWHPQWSADIATNTKLAMKELHGDKYAKMYAEYAGDMIYAKEVPDYETALNRIDEIIIDIFG